MNGAILLFLTLIVFTLYDNSTYFEQRESQTQTTTTAGLNHVVAKSIAGEIINDFQDVTAYCQGNCGPLTQTGTILTPNTNDAANEYVMYNRRSYNGQVSVGQVIGIQNNNTFPFLIAFWTSTSESEPVLCDDITKELQKLTRNQTWLATIEPNSDTLYIPLVDTIASNLQQYTTITIPGINNVVNTAGCPVLIAPEDPQP